MTKYCFAISIFLFLGCYSTTCIKRTYNWQPYAYNPCYENPKILNSAEFINFQKKCVNSKRDTFVIDGLISDTHKAIENWLNFYDKYFMGKDSLLIKFMINYKGRFTSLCFLNECEIDTTAFNEIDNKIKDFHIEAYGDSSIYTEISILARKNMNNISIARLGKPLFCRHRTKAEIMQFVMDNVKHLRYAYNSLLRRIPSAHGRIDVRFVIREDGIIDKISVIQSNFCDSTFDSIVVAKIRKWKFPALESTCDATEVVYPFIFSY